MIIMDLLLVFFEEKLLLNLVDCEGSELYFLSFRGITAVIPFGYKGLYGSYKLIWLLLFGLLAPISSLL
ncbi:MAG: hypothetical protein C0613_14035 [Desulfobulbaceae bacterium]|nr:MAG: hypothetical protein C0613_14035 [Desulfobulbaceae bacterium]